MGRKPTKNFNLPPRMRAMRKSSGKIYYYHDAGMQPDGSRPYNPLGANFIDALRQYAELETNATQPVITFPEAVSQFQIEELAKKAHTTQKDILWSLPNLLDFFGNPPAPLDQIKPIHIRQYLDRRGKAAPTRANREIAWFSVIFNWSRNKGFTEAPNPCAGIKRHREKGRSIYVHDDDLATLKEHADAPLCDAIDLAYLTGQRPADVLKMQETNIRDGALEIRQNKTGMPIRIAVVGELAKVIERCKLRKDKLPIHTHYLLTNEEGQKLTKSMLRGRFERARAAAAAVAKDEETAMRIRAIQFRDLRAKAATDKADIAGDIRQAQEQLGHTSVSMTEHYVRQRRGKKVTPTK